MQVHYKDEKSKHRYDFIYDTDTKTYTAVDRKNKGRYENISLSDVEEYSRFIEIGIPQMYRHLIENRIKNDGDDDAIRIALNLEDLGMVNVTDLLNSIEPMSDMGYHVYGSETVVLDRTIKDVACNVFARDKVYLNNNIMGDYLAVGGKETFIKGSTINNLTVWWGNLHLEGTTLGILNLQADANNIDTIYLDDSSIKESVNLKGNVINLKNSSLKDLTVDVGSLKLENSVLGKLTIGCGVQLGSTYIKNSKIKELSITCSLSDAVQLFAGTENNKVKEYFFQTVATNRTFEEVKECINKLINMQFKKLSLDFREEENKPIYNKLVEYLKTLKEGYCQDTYTGIRFTVER